MAEKYFNRQEAEELLPLIERSLVEAQECRAKVEDLDRELTRAKTDIMARGGSLPAYGKLASNRSEREERVARLQSAIEHIQDTGCLLKDLDQGLIDFPAMREGEEVYLCWKLGEERIGYWHRIEDGFAGRQPLDEDEADEPRPGGSTLQ